MKDKKAVGIVVCLSALLVGPIVALSWFRSSPSLPDLETLAPGPLEKAATSRNASPRTAPNTNPSVNPSVATGEPSRTPGGCGSMHLGRFQGNVDYDKKKDTYFLQLRGSRFPFKASPLDAQAVPLEAPGRTELERNTALINGVLGRQVDYATLLANPDEEAQVMPAATDLSLYLRIVNRRKFAGLAYTKAGGRRRRSVARGAQIQSWQDATVKTPKILLKGPKSGATKTRVVVAEGGRVTVEGATYQDLYKAADSVCVTLLKMLCGSPNCPDAAACATGGKCGCG